MVGKPVESRPRSVRMILRALPQERVAWKRAAKRAGLTFSEWIRRLANEAAKVKR